MDTIVQLGPLTGAHYGHDVRGCFDGVAMDIALSDYPADIIVIDVLLTGESGLKVAQRLRRDYLCGVILLGDSGRSDAKVQGYLSGADHYFTNPVVTLELYTAILSLSKRLTTLSPNIWVHDIGRSTLLTPSGVEIPLSLQQNIVLELICSKPGKIVARLELFTALGHADDQSARQRLETLVCRFRTKVQKADPDGRLPVRARHGSGYSFLDTHVYQIQ